MQSENSTAVVIVTYNQPDLLILQVEAITKFCKDDFDIWVIDNSTKQQAIDSIKHHAERLGCKYMKVRSASRGGSESHAFAANTSYHKISNEYGYTNYLYLDHDCFPVQTFAVSEILGNGHVCGGIGQQKDKLYFWPGCLMFKADPIIDFSCYPGLDTGGGTYKVIEKYGQDACLFFDEEYCQNPYYHGDRYNHYTLINKGMFMHFVNGSNWNTIPDNQERINTLINVLREKIDAA